MDTQKKSRSAEKKSFFFNDVLDDDDLLTEILLRLPRKSAHQYKSVSKRWLSLISKPYFAEKYIQFREPACAISSRYSLLFEFGLSSSKSRMIEIASSTSTGPPFKSHEQFSFSFLQEFDSFDLQGSCNGLVLFRATSKNRQLYIVSNPFTRQWVTLPESPQQHIPVRVGFICDSDISQGILFSNFTQYKVVVIDDARNVAGHVPADVFKINIFSSCSGDWSEIRVQRPLGFDWKGCIRPLIACANMLIGCVCGKRSILIYDPYKNPSKCSFISMPSDIISGGCYTVGVSRGNILQVCSHVALTFPLTLRVWELKEFSSCAKWILKHKIQLSISDMVSNLVPSIPHEDIKGSLMVVAIDGDNIAYLMFRHRLLLFNMKSKIIKVVFLPGGELNTTLYSAHKFFPFFFPEWPTSIPKFKPN